MFTKLFITAFITISIFGTENVEPIDVSNQCEFFDKTILSHCYWRGAWSREELIIRDQKAFQDYGKKIKDERSKCETATLPKIDFSEFTLLSKLTKGGCCSDNYDRRVLKDTINKTIVYEIQVEYIGTCEKLCGNFNWVLVPKIPKEYSIEFISD